MTDLFIDIFQWIAALPPLWAYLTILAIAYGENVVPPIPGDMVVVFGGYLAATGQLSLTAVVVLSTLGGVLGFMTMYAVGYRIGGAVMAPNRLRWIPKKKVRRVQEHLYRWGYGIVAANRFLSGLRSVISLTVGMAQMPIGRTAAYATLSAAIWTALIAYLGFAVGENWAVVRGYLGTYGKVMGSLIVLAFVGLWAYRRYRRRQRPFDVRFTDPLSGGVDTGKGEGVN